MQMSHDEIMQLIDTKQSYPRSMTDVSIGILTDSLRPGEPVVVVVDSALWVHDINVGRVIYSLDLETAERLHNDLGAVIEAIGER